jgi:hypothetical protein
MAIFVQKKIMFFPAVKFYVLWTVIKTLKVIPIDLKCWIRIRIETSADPQHWLSA